MEGLKRLRTPVRSGFSRIAKCLEECIEHEKRDYDEIEILMAQLEEKWSELNSKEKEIQDLLMSDSKCTQDDFDREYEAFASYNERYIKCKTKVKKILSISNCVNTEDKSYLNETVSKRKFKLPKIEIKKFSGDVKEWLGFWGQFKKIHEDAEIAPEDKLQYLSQSTVEGSRARDLVDSFPPSAENYEQVIEYFKARFGRDDLLIEVYVRELLSLVLTNCMNRSKVLRLTALYDKIEAHLRALETLGVTSDKYASMLYPLVESCLPEDIIRVWERSFSLKNETDKPPNKLIALMSFLKSEVEGEERISIAKEGFGFDSKQKEKHSSYHMPAKREKPFPTAVGLFNAPEFHKNKQPFCIFCEKSHESSACRTASQMSLDDKRKIIANKGSCYLCFRVGHRVRACRSRIRCEKCNGRHHVIMCSEPKPKLNVKETHDDQNVIKDTALGNKTCGREVLLQTLYVRLRGKTIKKTVRALIDSGSQRSYLSKRMAKELEYDLIKEEKIIHNLFGGKEHPEDHSRYRVYISSLSGDYHCNFEVLDQQRICSNIPIPKLEPCSQELYDHDIIMTDQLISEKENSLGIDLLIGSDVAGKLLNGKVIQLPCGLVAVGTHLGWTLMGKMPYTDIDSDSAMIVTNLLAKDVAITELWDLDVIGITDTATKMARQERDLQTKVQFQNSVSINREGRYEVALPWAEDHSPLPTNKTLALKRLESATEKLRSQNLIPKYNEVFQNWLDLGIIEEVERPEDAGFCHYLPHRPVVKENSSTPVRPVFDASAKTKASPSLNQCLECGPNMIELIPSILLRFREGRFAAIADIEKAFLQISIRPEDRDYLRFFWKQPDDDKLKIYRHARVVFGVKSSPFLLSAVIEFHLQKYLINSPYDKEMLDKLLRSFYVDNVVTSFEDEAKMRHFIEISRKIMNEGKFNLRGWLCTGENFQKGEFVPVLGLLWDSKNDVLTFNLNWLENLELTNVTKRTVLAMTHKVFDPVGFLSPVLLFPKLILQSLWKTGISWDTEVEENIKRKFLNWCKELFLLKELAIPRWLHTDRINKEFCSIHTFCDASCNAYATAVFLRVETDSGVQVHLLSSKSRVAPVKPITIPRLELIAATVGARLCTSVLEGLQWQNVKLYFWTDSSTVLTWIQKEENWTVFVANRVKEIRKLTDTKAWRHISGANNPADLPSRGCSVKQFLQTRWWEGPPFLKKDENEWPTSSLVYHPEDIAREMRKVDAINTNATIETEQIFSRISSYSRLVRVVAWIYRFYFRVKSKNHQCTGNLTLKEINDAECILFKAVQKEAFPDGVNEKRIMPLHPMLNDKGLLRVKTLIFRRKNKKNFRLPILLPSKHRIVQMLIRSKHEELGHPGVQILMNHLRENYWVLQSRKAVRQVISRCIRCKRFTVTHPEPKATSLTEDRVKEASIFEIVGTDLAGPLYLKDGSKAWIVLFTCAIYRAVHMELITSLTAEAFIQSLRRFIARRGRPTIIYSDNGSNFVKAHSELSKLDWQKIESQSALKKITWKFIPPSAPWWGGWWERLIGMIKQNLRRVLGQALLNYEELNTVLCDTESLINSRPLTYLSEDINDLIALSPSMFLQETKESGVPDIDKIDVRFMRKRYQYIQKVREDLRKRFRIEYLGQLQHAKKPADNSKCISVGDLVLIGSDNLKRLMWPVGRVTEVLPGKDGIVRVLKLKTKSGILTRPVQRIYPLEIAQDSDHLYLRKKVPVTVKDLPTSTMTTRSGRTVKPVRKFDI